MKKRINVLVATPLLVCAFRYSSVAAKEPNWIAVPLVNRAVRQTGSTGGEGGQVIRCIAISESNPSLLMMGTDVGGIYRSLDAGLHWQVCMSGWNARGGNAFAIDPRNPDRILGVGGNGNDFGPASNGVYLSVDRGSSWRQVLARNDGNESRRDSLAFDPRSYDDHKGFCSVAYFESRDGGLFKSTDGGLKWDLINKDRTGAAMKVHPEKGFIYLADNSQKGHGFYKSIDGGVNFKKVNENFTLGLDVITSRPDVVYISRWDKVLVSDDEGETFHPVGKNAGLPDGTPIQDIRVSPANPHLMFCKHGGKQWWESYCYQSQDGGNSWQKIAYDNSLAFLPFTGPEEKCVFHPTDPKIIFNAAAGGWVVKSSDGGRHFAWFNQGQNAIMVGSTFNFSRSHPDVLFLSFQDFGGAATQDGGTTWDFRNASGNGWGGFDYGGYTPDGKTLWCGDAPSWTGHRTLKISSDGGATWTVAKDKIDKPIILGPADISFSDPLHDQNCFASNYRSGDAGKTWGKMSACDGVYTASPDGALLYGRNGKAVCVSANGGNSWKDCTTALPGEVHDLAVGSAGARIFAISDQHLQLFENGKWATVNTPEDQYGQIHLNSVAIDPGDSSVLYAGGSANIYSTSVTVIKSVDGGKTFANLTPNEAIKQFPGHAGPHEVQWLRVHPATRDLWVNGQCFGMWKLSH